MNEQQRPVGEPTETAIREQLQRMLARSPFARSPVLSRFLAHVVEHALTSDAPALKEYAIGLEVFERPDDFDPRIDTIVRVQARRLREALDRYYDDAGRGDPVRLAMPKGQYGIQSRPARGGARHEPVAGDGTEIHARIVFSAAPLPAPRTPLIGRDSELGQLVAMVADNSTRLLTITGVGGTGKTRLALEVAQAARSAFPGGVVFLDLSAVTRRSVLVDMLASAIRLGRPQGRSPLEAIIERIRTSLERPALLVLDNFEGVLEGADVLGSLLDATAHLSILATSRVALRLYGEHEFSLAPLQVPDASQRHDPGTLATVPAVRLFLLRASAANPRARLGDDLDALGELCVRLDGLPLAIELVAAQAGTLGARQMLERFTGHLDLPENPARDAPSRQRTLRRTIDWSYELLDETGRCVLRRLSVFAGGFTLEAAEAVADVDAAMGEKLMVAVNALVALGLMYFRAGEDEPRYAMLETLRAYGRERLNACDEAEAASKAHAAYYLVLAEEGVGRLDVAAREAWLLRCDLEQDNFRLALDWLLCNGPHAWALRLGHALFFYWERRERLSEGRRQLQRIVETIDPQVDTSLWARVSIFVATMDAYQGDLSLSINRIESVLDRYRSIGDRKGEADALGALGVSERLRGNDESARSWLRQCLALTREVGDRNEIAAALSNLAQCEMHLGQSGEARALLTEAHAAFTATGNAVPAAWCLNHLGDAARLDGDTQGADALYARAEAEFEKLGDLWGLARTRDDRCRLAIEGGDHAKAGPVLLQVLAFFESLDHQRGMAAVTESIAAFALAGGHPELSVKLVSAARSWRAAVGYTPRPDDMRYPRHVLEQAACTLDKVRIEELLEAGRRLSPADVAEVLRSVIDHVD